MKIDFEKDATAWDAIFGCMTFEDIGLLLTALHDDDSTYVDIEGKEYLLAMYMIFRNFDERYMDVENAARKALFPPDATAKI